MDTTPNPSGYDGNDEEYEEYSEAELAYIAGYQRAMEKLGEEKKPVKGRKAGFITGLAVIVLALTGVVFLTLSAVRALSSASDKKQEKLFEEYNAMLIPVAAIDPDGFDDISTAPMNELVHIALWSILGSDLDPSVYQYSGDELLIPAADVEKAFVSFFGNQIVITHTSVEGYGYEFKYDAERNVYAIPLTTITPIYTPKVTSVDSKGGSTVITCGLINSSMWMQDHATGEILSPEPDKFIKVTLREFSGATYVSSIQSSGTPETASPNAYVYTPMTTEAAPSEPETVIITRD